MKNREIYSELRVIPPIVVRIDGRNFKNTLQRLQFKKPYSIKFAKAMADSIELFFRDSGLNPILGYTFSDEINLLFFELPFKGRVEKLDSIIPSFFSSALTILLTSYLKIPSIGAGAVLSFDARVILLNKDNIIEY
ncbi:MAG: tRNA(His) guanylyltransferase Thg1 family protein, partial [Methanosarcinales archaeon]